MNWTQEQVVAHGVRLLGHSAGAVTSGKPVPALGRLHKPAMNRTETAYAAHLDLQMKAGAILWYGFEAITVKLGEDCRFTPDFLVMLPGGRLECRDTKGSRKIKVGSKAGQTRPYVEEDALVKARVMARHFVIPIFFVWRDTDGEWGKKEL